MSFRDNNPDVLLVFPPAWGADDPPPGIAYLSAYLAGKGMSAQVLDLNIRMHNAARQPDRHLWEMGSKNFWRDEDSFGEILDRYGACVAEFVEQILSSGARVVGFSIADPRERMGIELARRVKYADAARYVIFGGPSCLTEDYRRVLAQRADGAIDAFIAGEGEVSLYELLLEIKKAPGSGTESLREVPGASIRKESGYSSLSPRELIPSLDSLPPPTFDEFDLIQYRARGSLTVEWSRGCVWNCHFCQNRFYSPRYRHRSSEHVFREVEHHVRTKRTSHLSVCDPAVNGNPSELEKICDRLIAAGFDLRWSALATPRRDMTPELLWKMRKSGCYRLEFGIESGSDRVLKLMNKHNTVADAERTLKMAHDAGIVAVVFLIVGFPGETERDVDETIEFLYRNEDSIDVIKSLNALYLQEGTYVYEHAGEFGIRFDRNDPKHNYNWTTADGSTVEVRNRRIERILRAIAPLDIHLIDTSLTEMEKPTLKA